MTATPIASRIPYYGSNMPYDGWTTDDLDALPQDGIRRELVDGVLFVTPPPSLAHQDLVWRLCATLDPLLPPHLVVNQGCGVRITHKRSFVPDVLIVNRDAKTDRSNAFRPADVLLAVEIVSPTSVSIDRILKPALYASAGIASSWRIEPTEDYRLHAYALAPGGIVYADAGEFDGLVAVAQPWPMKFDLAAIKPE